MKTKFLLFLILLYGYQLRGILNLEHSPPANFPKEFVLATDQTTKLKRAFFYYRAVGELNFRKLEKDNIRNSEISFRIPNPFNYEGLEYYFEVETETGEVYTLPQVNAALNPFRLIKTSAEKKKSDGFVLLSPDKNYSPDRQLVIAVSYFAIAEKIDKNSIKLVVNGKVKPAEIGKNMLVYELKNLNKSSYEFYVKATSQGRQLTSLVWNFEPKRFVLPWNLTGNTRLNMEFQTEKSDTITTQNDLQIDLRLNIRARKDWWRARSYLYLSSLESANKQPVNRYYLKFAYPAGEVTVGDYFANGNSFATYGKYIRGFAHKLLTEKFRFYSAFGQIRRSTKGSSYTDAADSVQYNGGTFSRHTLALRTEVGNQRKFIWGLEFVKNKDNIGSLAKKYYQKPDSSYSITPKDNVVLATDARLAMFRQRLVWETEVAMSLYNSDILGGAISLDSLEADLDEDLKLPFDPEDWESFFVINENIEPVVPSLNNVAFKTNLRAFFNRNLLNISYSTVGSSFHSLATDYVKSDARIFSVNDNLSLMNNRMNLNLGFSTFSDNVYDHKTSTTTSHNYHSQVYYRPTEMPTFRLGMNISDSKNEKADIPYRNLYYDYQFSVIYPYEAWDAKVVVSYNHSDAENRYASTYSSYESENIDKITRNRIAVDLQKQLPTSKMNFGVSFRSHSNPSTISYADSSAVWQQVAEKSSYNNNSFYFRNKWKKIDEKWQPYVKLRFSSYHGDIDSQSAFSAGGGSDYFMNAKTSVVWDNRLYFYRNADNGSQDWHEVETNLKIRYRF